MENRLRYVDFEHCGYKVAFNKAQKSDMIYCDPPYSHGQSILYGAHGGRSMLRRFQREGETLEDDKVADRLLLTY